MPLTTSRKIWGDLVYFRVGGNGAATREVEKGRCGFAGSWKVLITLASVRVEGGGTSAVQAIERVEYRFNRWDASLNWYLQAQARLRSSQQPLCYGNVCAYMCVAYTLPGISTKRKQGRRHTVAVFPTVRIAPLPDFPARSQSRVLFMRCTPM